MRPKPTTIDMYHNVNKQYNSTAIAVQQYCNTSMICSRKRTSRADLRIAKTAIMTVSSLTVMRGLF